MIRLRASLACLAAALSLVLAGAPVRAEQFDAGELLPHGPQAWPVAQNDSSPHADEYLLGRTHSLGNPELFSLEMIRDENRFKLELFTLSRETIIPLASAHLYIVHAVRVSQIKRGKVEALTPEEAPPRPWDIKDLPSGLSHLPEGLAAMGKLRSLLGSQPLPEVKGWRPFGWLTEDEGLLSGRPWSWENFMPRLLTMAGMVLGGLLAVEVLRALLAVGERVVGDKERSKRPS